MTEENRRLFLEYAMGQAPREACGLLLIEKGKERLQVCKNVSDYPDTFILDPDGYRATQARGEIVGLVHSHVFKPPFPSDADKVACNASGLPWFIVSVPAGSWHELNPKDFKAPLIGRQFAYGVLDCYILVQDYYREKLGISLVDFDHGSFGWWDKGERKFSLENCAKAGFFEVPLSEIKEHDILLMQIHGKEINHLAIYLGKDLILHHLSHRLSSRDVLSGYYLRHSVRAVRHEAVK